MTYADWRRVLSVNLDGAFLGTNLQGVARPKAKDRKTGALASPIHHFSGIAAVSDFSDRLA